MRENKVTLSFEVDTDDVGLYILLHDLVDGDKAKYDGNERFLEYAASKNNLGDLLDIIGNSLFVITDGEDEVKKIASQLRSMADKLEKENDDLTDELNGKRKD